MTPQEMTMTQQRLRLAWHRRALRHEFRWDTTLREDCPLGGESVGMFGREEERAIRVVAAVRWPKGARCPRCRSGRVSYLPARRIWQCRDCRRQFSARTGTILEDCKVPLGRVLYAI